MSLFEFTFALSAVVLGLALTHVASAIHKLILAGKRVRWAPETLLLTLIVMLVIVTVWLAAWSDKDQTTVTVWQMLLQVAKLLTLYVAAASCLPEPDSQPTIDLFRYYDQTRLISFGSLILSLLLFRLYDLTNGGMPSSWTIEFVVYLVLYPSLYAILIFVRRRWLNILILGVIIANYGWRVAGQQLAS